MVSRTAPERRVWAVALALACAVVALAASAVVVHAGPARVTLRAADVHVADYPTVQGLKFMADTVGALSGGRIQIEIFPGGQLGDERSTIEQVQLGVIDMVRTSTAPLAEFYRPFGVFSLPYIFRDEAHMWRVVMGPVGQRLLRELERAGMVGLAYYDAGARHFYTTKKPVRSPEDLRGLRIRTQQAQVVIDMMQALGASAVPMAFGEVYTSLQTGVIDGAENNVPSYGPFGVRHYEVARYFSLDGHLRVPEIVIISKQSWDRLSPDDRQLLKEAALASVVYQATLWDLFEEKTMVELRKAGVEIITVDTSAFQKAVAPVYDRYRPQFGALIDEILNR